MSKIILASASPRRQELLKLIFEDFTVLPANVDEEVPDYIPVFEIPQYLSRIKALDVASKFPEAVIIGADTCVFVDGEILGKPKNDTDAYNMLRKLSGKIHSVITGCTIIKNNVSKTFSVETKVEFFNLSDKEIYDYISTKDCFDKAGAYGIQSKGSLFVKSINGDYFNVVGLPIAMLNKIYKSF